MAVGQSGVYIGGSSQSQFKTPEGLHSDTGCAHICVKMALLLYITVILSLFITECNFSICGVISGKRCKCSQTVDYGNELQCNRIGYSSLPIVDYQYRQKLNIFRARGNFITTLHDADIFGYKSLTLLDLRSQRHGQCVLSKLTFTPKFMIIGLCDYQVM